MSGQLTNWLTWTCAQLLSLSCRRVHISCRSFSLNFLNMFANEYSATQVVSSSVNHASNPSRAIARPLNSFSPPTANFLPIGDDR